MITRFITLLLFCTNAFGQLPAYELTYEYINAGLGERRIVTLLVNSRESLSVMTTADSVPSNSRDFNLGGEDERGRQVYRSAATGELVFRDFVSRNGMFEPCVVKDELKYAWTFEPVARKIGPYECRGASTQFRGRSYMVWYAEGLAISAGPWKFAGLPGAMIEIQSDDKAISFRLLKISSTKKTIPKTSPAMSLSMADYVRLREASATDFINRLAAQLPRGAQISLETINDNNLEIIFDDVKH